MCIFDPMSSSFINQQIALSHSLSQHPLSATSTSYSPSTPTIPQTSNLLKRLITVRMPHIHLLPALERIHRLSRSDRFMRVYGIDQETTSLTHNLNNSSRQLQELQKRVTLDGEDAVRGARIMDASKVRFRCFPSPSFRLVSSIPVLTKSSDAILFGRF